MAKQDGPKLRIVASCSGCTHKTNDEVQGSYDARCAHPKSPEPKRIDNTTWDTPKWCPLFDVALSTLLQNTVLTR